MQRPSRPVRRSVIEFLETRIAPATLDVSGGIATFTAGTGIGNNLTVAMVGANYTFGENAETIVLTAAAVAAGFTGSGTTQVTGPNLAVTGIMVDLGDQNDVLNINGLTDALSVNGDAGIDTVSFAGATTPAGNVAVTAENVNVTSQISATGAVTFTTDTLVLNANLSSPTLVTFQPQTAGRAITLGSEVAGTLSLTNAEINHVATNGVLRVGNEKAGAITLTAGISTVNATTLALVSDSTISGAGSIFALNLRLTGRDGIALTNAANDVNRLAAEVFAAGADISFRDSDDLIIDTVDTVEGVSTRTAAGAVITLLAGATTQTAAGRIAGLGLELLGAGPFTLTNPSNDVVTVAANIAGRLAYTDADSTNVGLVGGTAGLTTANSEIVFTVVNGNIIVFDGNVTAAPDVNAGANFASLEVGAGGAITFNANAGLSAAFGIGLRADNLVVNAPLNAGSNALFVTTSGTATSLNLGGADAAGQLGLTDAELDLMTGSQISIRTLGSAISVSAAISPANTSLLVLTSGGDITGAGTLAVTNLRLTAAGPISLVGSNNVGALAANSGGTVNFSNGANPLILGFFGFDGVVTSNDDVLLIADSFDLQNFVKVGTARVTLQPFTATRTINLGTATGGLDLTDAELDRITAGVLQLGNGTASPVNLSSAISPANVGTLTFRTTSSVTGAGSIVVPALRVEVAGPVTLTGANDVNSLAGKVTVVGQHFSFQDADGFVVDAVDGLSGIGAPPATAIILNAGTVTQTLGNKLSAGFLSLLGAGPFTLREETNNVATIGANVTGGLAYIDADALFVGLAASTNGIVSTSGLVQLIAIDGDLQVTDQRIGADISAGPGALLLTAGFGHAVVLNPDAGLSASGGIFLTADNMTIGANVNGGANVIMLAAIDNARTINLGTENSTRLSLTDLELDFMTAAVVRIGYVGTGAIEITAALDTANTNTLVLRSGSTIKLVGNGRITEEKVAIATPGAVSLATSSNAIEVLAANVGGDFTIKSFGPELGIGTVDGITGVTAINQAITITTGALEVLAPLNAGTGVIKILTTLNGLPISLGNAVTGFIDLRDDELDRMTASRLELGALPGFSPTTGPITISSDVSPAAISNLALHTDFTISGDGILRVPVLDVEAVGDVSLKGDVEVFSAAAANLNFSNAGNLALGSINVGSGNGTFVLNARSTTQASGAVVKTGVLRFVGVGPYTLTDLSNDAKQLLLGPTSRVEFADFNGFVLPEQTIDGSLSMQTLFGVTQSGPLSGTGDLKLSGSGVLNLSLANPFSGRTTVSGGVLTGVGSLAGEVLVEIGSLAPGVGTGFGVLTLGSLTFLENGRLILDLAALGSGSDVVIVNGGVNLHGRLTLSPDFTVSPGLQYMIIANDGDDAVSGTFKNLPEGAVIEGENQFFQISYQGGDGNDVVVTALTSAPAFTNKGKTATFFDLDGDLVTVKTSLGEFTAANFRLAPAGNAFGGAGLQLLQLGPEFKGANLTITAKRGSNGGNGFVNVGYLNAPDIDLGTIVVDGDLGRIDCGDDNALKPALKSLAVHSYFGFGLGTQGLDSSNVSTIKGKLPKLTVKSDIRGALIIAHDTIGAVTIGGSFLGGALITDLNIGTVIVRGNIQGTAEEPVRIEAYGKSVAPIAGVDLAIKSISVSGGVESLLVTTGLAFSVDKVNADASIGTITVAGDWRASSVRAGVLEGVDGFMGTADDAQIGTAFFPGAELRDNPAIFSQIAKITIKGQALGTVATFGDSFGIVAEMLKAANVAKVKFTFAKGPNSAADAFAAAATIFGPNGAISDFFLREAIL